MPGKTARSPRRRTRPSSDRPGTSANSVWGRVLFAPTWQRRTVGVLVGVATIGVIVGDSRGVQAATLTAVVLTILAVVVLGYAVIVVASYVQDHLDRRRRGPELPDRSR